MTAIKFALGATALALLSVTIAADPLACQPNAEFPMLPIYHIIGNVTKSLDGSIKLEPINDCSGITFSGGVWHVWHQCCQNHFDHIISKDLIHWQRLPPPIQPLKLKTWDGSVTDLPAADGGPVIIYDAQDGKLGVTGKAGDSPILGVARPADPTDKYQVLWTRDASNPVKFTGAPGAFPGQIWKNGDHWNFIMQGARYSTNDSHFMAWTNEGKMIGLGEHGGQWWVPVPNQIDGTAPPAEVGNYLVNTGGGTSYLFGKYDPSKETFTPWSPNGEKPGKTAQLEGGKAGWWGGQSANDRMMIIGWATPDYHGDAGKGIGFLTRLTLLREVNFDAKTMDLVSNPVPELVGLRTSSLASEQGVELAANGSHAVAGTTGGAAASADVNLTFSGFSDGSTFGACVLANNTGEGLGIKITVTGKMATATFGTCTDTGLDSMGGPKPGPHETANSFPIFDETEINVRITPDRSVADFFVQGGRSSGTVSWLSKTPRASGDSAISVWSGAAGVKADIDVWGMGCGWATPSYTEDPALFV